MKKLLLIFLIVLAIPQLCYARIIYESKNKILLVGGVLSYYDAQPYEGRDRSLNKRIVKYDSIERKKELLYSSKFNIAEITISPNGQYVAFNMAESHKYSSIVIISMDGKEITTIKNNVRIFQWSPDSRYLAYITGELLSESRQPFKSDGLWIYDLKKDRKEKTSDKAFELRFGRYDGKLHYGYERGKGPAKFYIYDPDTKMTEQVNSFGMDFSPDGNYFVKGYESTDYALYKFAEKKPVHWFSGLKFDEVYWLNNELIFNFFLPRSFVYDVFKRKIIHEFEGTVMGWSANRKYVISYKDKEAIITETLSGKIINRIKIRD